MQPLQQSNCTLIICAKSGSLRSIYFWCSRSDRHGLSTAIINSPAHWFDLDRVENLRNTIQVTFTDDLSLNKQRRIQVRVTIFETNCTSRANHLKDIESARIKGTSVCVILNRKLHQDQSTRMEGNPPADVSRIPTMHLQMHEFHSFSTVCGLIRGMARLATDTSPMPRQLTYHICAYDNFRWLGWQSIFVPHEDRYLGTLRMSSLSRWPVWWRVMETGHRLLPLQRKDIAHRQGMQFPAKILVRSTAFDNGAYHLTP